MLWFSIKEKQMEFQDWFNEIRDKFILEKVNSEIFKATCILSGGSHFPIHAPVKNPERIFPLYFVPSETNWKKSHFLMKGYETKKMVDYPYSHYFCCCMFQKIFKIYKALAKK